VSSKELNLHYFDERPRQGRTHRPSPERKKDFDATKVEWAAEQALEEAARCFNCAVCNGCHNCFYFCPDYAIKIKQNGSGPRFSIDMDYCKGCGICVHECPRAAMTLVEGAQ